MISYHRYHKDNNYEYEELNYPIDKIIERHTTFLNNYFDVILSKLIKILKKFKIELKKYLHNIPNLPNFLKIVELTERFYPTILKSSYAYNTDNLQYIYDNIDEHLRYETVINNFIIDLKEAIQETIENIDYTINSISSTDVNNKFNNISIIFSDDKKEMTKNESDNTIIIEIEKAVPKKLNFSYELSKLVQNKAFHLFKWNKKSLLSKIGDNEVIIEELNHMEENFNNDFEYHCSFNYMSRILDDMQKST